MNKLFFQSIRTLLKFVITFEIFTNKLTSKKRNKILNSYASSTNLLNKKFEMTEEIFNNRIFTYILIHIDQSVE